MTTEHTCGGGCDSTNSSCGGGCGGHRYKHARNGALALLAIAGSLYLLALFANTVAEHKYIGRDMPGEQATISVSGGSETFASPDIATVSFSITHEAKNSLDARKLVDTKMTKIHNFLSKAGVLEKDIKTTSYNLYPKYEWQEEKIVCIAYPCHQPPGKQVLLGYEVSQSVEVKIRVLDDAGKVLGGLTDNGATNVSGLSFLVENEDAVKATAREQAIAKAKVKAEKLAKDLGVRLVRIVSFSEGGNYPIYYGRGGGMEMKAMSADAVASAPSDVPAGENKYTSNVTIIYEIK